MKKQKGVFPPQRDPAKGGTTLLVGIIIIIAVALVAFGGVFAYQYFTKSQVPISNNQQNFNVQNQNTETASWKTYTNDEFGFELKYPADFKTTADVNPAGYLNLNLGYSNAPYIGDIAIGVIKNKKNETAAQYFSREEAEAVQAFASKCQTCANSDVDAELYDCLSNKAKVLEVGGKQGFFCSQMPQRTTYSSPIYVFNGGYIYRFWDYDESNPSYEIYKQILSTFKFTK